VVCDSFFVITFAEIGKDADLTVQCSTQYFRDTRHQLIFLKLVNKEKVSTDRLSVPGVGMGALK